MTFANAKEIVMGEVTCQGKPALFSELRLDSKTIPKPLHVYQVRHSDEDSMKAVTVEKQVMVNHRGTLITIDKLDLGRDGIYRLAPDDLNFRRDEIKSLEFFMQQHRIKSRMRDDHER
jgi:hypothetical protein